MQKNRSLIGRFGAPLAAIVLCACTAPTPVSAQNGGAAAVELTVTPAEKAVIVVDTTKVIRAKLPDTLFGFNIRWSNFETDLWNAARNQVYPSVISSLKPFAGAMYRYPGGTVANSYDWEAARQPMEMRRPLNAQRPRSQALPLFGIDEYLAFVGEVNGAPFYTLNLLGREAGKDITEFPSAQLAASNRRLAEYLKQRFQPLGIPRLYQLGNELDRGNTEWSHQKYVSRALDTMNAMREIDPEARFVAFVREFNWKYRLPGHSGMSRSDEFIRDVMLGMPKLNDLSLNSYYDGTLREGGKFFAIDELLSNYQRVLSIAQDLRPGQPVSLWVTEHSRRIGGEDENVQGRNKTLASGLGGALSSADFLIGLAQMPQVAGASWHALNGVDRRLFEPGADPLPTAVYWALRVLRVAPSGAVVATSTASPNLSRYQGGYDIRAAALTSGSDGPLTVWAINRASRTAPATLQVPTWKGRKVTLQHYFVAGPDGVAADQVGNAYHRELQAKPVAAQFSADGTVAVTLPPSSISTFVVTTAK